MVQTVKNLPTMQETWVQSLGWECWRSFQFSRFCLATAKSWSDGWTSDTAPCYSSVLFGKQREIHPRGVRAGGPKRLEEKRSPWLNFGSAFYFLFLLPLSLPYVNLACQEGCLFYLRFSLQSSNLPLFYFCGLFPSLSFSHRHSGLLFPILTT